MTQRPGANTEKTPSSSPSAAPSSSSRPPSSAATLALSLANEVVSGTSTISVDQYVRNLSDPKDHTAQQAARVVEELANLKPELLAPHIEALVTHLGSATSPRARCGAHCLPLLARVAPAKVAKHLKTLQGMFPAASDIAKDGLVRTFVALCVASVTYQKRLIDNFELALRTADSKQLTPWTEHILPALKGEPYAQARGVVEQRLSDPALPRPVAQRVADLLGVKLRAIPERK